MKRIERKKNKNRMRAVVVTSTIHVIVGILVQS